LNIYALFPLIATIVYIPLIINTLIIRPLLNQHKLFIAFLIPAMLWSLADFFGRALFFPEQSLIISKLILAFLSVALTCFHIFASSFYARGEKHWLPLAFTTMAAITILIILGYLPRDVIIKNSELYPDYGPWILVMAVPFLSLASRNFYVFTKKLKTIDDPVVYNQIVSLTIGLAILTVFLLASILPWGREFPISHVGNIFTAILLSYATLRHKLVPVSFVLRRGTIWLVLFTLGILTYWGMMLAVEAWFGIHIDIRSSLAASVIAVIIAIVIYIFRNLLFTGINKVFQGERFVHLQNLTGFVANIHNVFNFEKQGREFLNLVIKAFECKKTCLLFLDPGSEEFITLIAEPNTPDNQLDSFKLSGHNPISEYLKRELKPLAKRSLEILPEFRSLWTEEKEKIKRYAIELFIPLISRGKLIGILVLDKKQSGKYSLADYNLLEEVANRVAVSMEKEYLQEQLREREKELSILNRSSSIITSSLHLQHIYDNFTREIKQVVDVNWTAIVVIEEHEARFVTLSTEIGSAWQVGERIPLKGTGIEWVASEKKPLIEHDLNFESRFDIAKYHIQHGVRSIAYIPLIVGNKVIGVLMVASRNPKVYSTKQVKLLEELSAQIAWSVENSRLFAKAEQMARIDGLTGLLNRNSFDEIISNEIGRHMRYGGVFSVVIIDVDSFKEINDTYGHLTGDDILKKISQILKSTIRSADQAFRYGGDEFAILLPQTNTDAAFNIAERLRERIYNEIKTDGTTVTISLGIAGWPADAIGVNEIIMAADMALYHAKRSGANQSQLYTLAISNGKMGTGVGSSDGSEYLSTIYAMAAAVDARDRYTRNHSKKVNEYALTIAEALNWGALEKSQLSICALLHDVGKIGITSEILNKTGKLTAEEWELLKAHPRLSASIVNQVNHLSPCLPAILHHHERYDGKGYPQGLKGEEIPFEARILTVADSFAAMTSERHYLTAMSFDQAIEELRKNTGTQFDPHLVEVFISATKNVTH
jgi:diguanylate cyclase (GGDEF)-like protein